MSLRLPSGCSSHDIGTDIEYKYIFKLKTQIYKKKYIGRYFFSKVLLSSEHNE